MFPVSRLPQACMLTLLGFYRANPRSKVLYSARLLLAWMSGWLCWKMKSVMFSFTCTREQIKTLCTTAGNSLHANSPSVQSLFSMQICFSNLSIPLLYHQSLEKAVDMWIVSVYACITLCVIKKLDVTAVGLCGKSVSTRLCSRHIRLRYILWC